MRNRFMLAALTAVALSSAPAHASTPLLACDVVCGDLFPGYWEDPSQQVCKSFLAISCGWY
jgi:hypothetical protein